MSRDSSIGKQNSTKAPWPLDVALGLLPFSLVLMVLVWMLYLPLGLHAVADFRQLYTGGYMIRTGHASELYDYDAQMRFQHLLFPEASKTSILLITHPPFEELLFALLSRYPYRVAFSIFSLLNLIAVTFAVWLLNFRLDTIRSRWRWSAVLLAVPFFPFSRALLQGQDSLLLLALLSLILVLIESNRTVWAGVVLGVAVFRFEIAVPIVLLFLLWRRCRLVCGFMLSAAMAGLVSLRVIGLDGVRMYINYMLSLSLRLDSTASIAKYADTPWEMMNLRGMISALFWKHLPHTTVQIFIAISSLLVIYISSRMKCNLPTAIVAASLVSYHFVAHDASIWIIPIFFALNGRSRWQAFWALCMLFSPLASFLPWNGDYGYLAAIPLLGLFVTMIIEYHRGLAAAAPHLMQAVSA